GESTITSEALAITLPHWNALHDKSVKLVEAYHEEFPLRRGIPREELKSKLKLSPRSFNALITKLINDQTVAEHSARIAKIGHKIQFNEQEQARVQALMRKFDQNPFSPPSMKECQAEAGDEIVNALIESNKLIAVSPDIVFQMRDYDLMVDEIRNTLKKNEKITLAEVRDLFKTSRKYAQALLEYLDATGITIRDGDFRKLKR
ncbi:MAG TPA: SelB C-terminal domain-containing protein, partial [Anaerolineales bacterium]|nr:SelB C-terminal domain-containing protein [Anaerolineales bacterium]